MYVRTEIYRKILDIKANRKYAESMNTTLRHYAGLLNEVILSDAVMGKTKPQCSTVNGEVIISEGKLRGLDIPAAVVLRMNETSLLFYIQLQNGRNGYKTDLLNQFLTPEMVRAYGEHAYNETITNNNFKPNQ